MKNISILFVVLVVLFCAPYRLAAQTASTNRPAVERGTGPFVLQTKRGPVTVRLLRREKDLVWVDQRATSGKFFETGIHTGQIVKFEIPRPRAFDTVDLAVTSEQIAQSQVLLRRVSDPLKPFRDLPGIPADEAYILQARLLERQSLWKEALANYEDILKQTYTPPQVDMARLRAGLCYSKLGQNDKALEYLAGCVIPDDDLNMLSDIYFVRAQALAAKGSRDEAIMDYLFLVVFYPFVQTNEARCLSATIPLYAANKDWDAASKTLSALQTQYPDSEFAKKAADALKSYEADLAKEKDFQTPK